MEPCWDQDRECRWYTTTQLELMMRVKNLGGNLSQNSTSNLWI